MILAGFLIALPCIYGFVGGWEGLTARVTQNLPDAAGQASFFSMDGIGVTAVVGYLVMLVPSFFISPGLIGKVFGAKDERAIRRETSLDRKSVA